MNLSHPEFISLAPFLGVSETYSLQAVPVRSSPIEVTKIFRPISSDATSHIRLPRCDAYFLMLYLDDAIHCDIRADGSLAPPRFCCRGSICVIDLRDGAAVALQTTLSSIAITMPKAFIAEVAELSPGLDGDALRCRRAELDPVVSNLGLVLLSLFERELSSSQAILRHLGIAICTHLLQDFPDPKSLKKDVVVTGHRVASMAKHFMRHNLSRQLSIADVAAITGLSVRQFSQTFKKATGLTANRWLLRARVEAAKELLSEHQLTFEEIAKVCGFAEQSHFAKVFAREVGVTPAVWRAKRVN